MEFTKPSELESDRKGNRGANLFSCDPGASYQKPHVERNHEHVRLILPKGTTYFLPTSFDTLTQDDIDLMMSHVNCYVRGALGDRTPDDLFTRHFGTEVADLFNIRRIPANNKDSGQRRRPQIVPARTLTDGQT